MLFNSVDFSIFLPIVFLLYWYIFNVNIKFQNAFIVLVSYFFYGWWEWSFLGLIFLSTVVDYFVAIGIYNSKKETVRKLLLWLSVLVNLGFLGFFKYFNFFINNFVQAFSFFGKEIPISSLDIILPVGISFYTFQTLSYTIDVYRRQLEPTKDFIAFTAYVSFFPQLVAGPIERAKNLLPQFYKSRKFDYQNAVIGLRQILWGLFKKIVIADTCAQFANEVFNNHLEYGGTTLILGAVFFAFQIYGDFSGYSDIAIGTAKLFGFNLKQNFAFPYFSRDIAEFWRRWHISLSTWFRDYLYIPLGGSRGNTLLKVRNILIIFIVSGFWHGANWTFIIWGALNAIFFIPILLKNKNRIHINVVAENKKFPSLKELRGMILTFSLTVIAWVFFRAKNINHALEYIGGMISGLTNYRNYYITYKELDHIGLPFLLIVLFFLLMEWHGRSNTYAIEQIRLKSRALRYSLYYIILASIFYYTGRPQEFIYFQF